MTLPVVLALRSASDQPLGCRAMVTAALPLRISLPLDQVDAAAVATVLAGVKSEIGAVSRYDLDHRDHQPQERHRTVRTWCLRPETSRLIRRRDDASPAEHRISVYILPTMKIVKVRRVGNSNVVSLPRELEASGYVPGTSVLVEELPDGELRILPTDRVRERVREIAARAVSERAEALEILVSHDADQDASQ
jgi:antitoxin component of MazEF toxin-antitoxin module